MTSFLRPRTKCGFVIATAMIGFVALPVIAWASPTPLTAGNATLQFSATGLPSPGGAVDVISLPTSDLGSTSVTINPGANQVSVSMANGGQIVEGSANNLYAAPVTGGTAADPILLTTPYFSTEKGQIFLGFSQQQSYLGLLWGSVGAGDEIAFYNTVISSVTPVTTLTGSELIADAGVNTADGSQGFNGSQYVLINLTGGLTFNDVALTQNVANSFESGNFEYSSQTQVAPVPEPPALPILAAGLFGIGLIVGRVRKGNPLQSR